jgi:hypothetical protein
MWWPVMGDNQNSRPEKMLDAGQARDGVERFGTPCFQQLADSTKHIKDTQDRKDSFCAVFPWGPSSGIV